MDPPTELPLNATREELAVGKINWLPRKRTRGRKQEEKGGGAGGMKKGMKEMVKANGTGREDRGRRRRNQSRRDSIQGQFKEISQTIKHKIVQSVIKDG